MICCFVRRACAFDGRRGEWIWTDRRKDERGKEKRREMERRG
jgi:hypothetical protein